MWRNQWLSTLVWFVTWNWPILKLHVISSFSFMIVQEEQWDFLRTAIRFSYPEYHYTSSRNTVRFLLHGHDFDHLKLRQNTVWFPSEIYWHFMSKIGWPRLRENRELDVKHIFYTGNLPLTQGIFNNYRMLEHCHWMVFEQSCGIWNKFELVEICDCSLEGIIRMCFCASGIKFIFWGWKKS